MPELSPDLAVEICNHVRDGKTLKAISKLHGFPDFKTIRHWYKHVDDFRDMVENAKAAAQGSEMPTIERQRQDGGVVLEPVARDLRGNVTQERARAKITCKIDWYYNAGTITPQMWHAGMRFALLFHAAGKTPRTGITYGERIQRSFSPSDYDRWLNEYSDAQKALTAALSILSSDEGRCVVEVAGYDQYAGTPGNTRTMRDGLRALASHWAIPHEIDGPF